MRGPPVWYRREGEWVGAATRIVHAATLEHTDYEYYTETACGLRGGRFDGPTLVGVPANEEIMCIACWAAIIRTPGARITLE